jgi:hypothetical protein
MMKTRYLIALMLLALTAGALRADTLDKTDKTETTTTEHADQSPQLELMDIPTADILDPMTYSTSFRFYNDGGLLSRLVIGPLRRVNLGIYFDAQRVIGSGDPHMITPAVFFKVKAFDGSDYLPALAFGYDNQGYLWQHSTKDFLQPEKGIYLVGSHALFVEQFELNAGLNVNNIDHDATLHGFFGASFKVSTNFSLLAEYDNIRTAPTNRVNLGGRYWIAPYFNIDFGARNVGRGAADGAERILRLNYVGRFPI